MEISGFVLAGGRSSRLGRDKALLPWPPEVSPDENRQTLLQHSVARLEMVCTTISVCANRNDLPFTGAIVPDALPGSGPLGGIVAALESSTTDWNLMLAVDLPFLPVELLQALVTSAITEESSVISVATSPQRVACILPQLDGLPQPLCGLYHRALLPGLQAALEAGKFKVIAALQKACDQAPSPNLQSSVAGLRLEMWDARAFAAAQPLAPNPCHWFLNINTQEEWQQARQLRLR